MFSKFTQRKQNKDSSTNDVIMCRVLTNVTSFMNDLLVTFFSYQLVSHQCIYGKLTITNNENKLVAHKNKISISLFYSSLSFIRVIRPVDNFRVILCQIQKN